VYKVQNFDLKWPVYTVYTRMCFEQTLVCKLIKLDDVKTKS